MAKWLEHVHASQLHEMYCHDLEVMSSDPGKVKLGVQVTLEQKIIDFNIVGSAYTERLWIIYTLNWRAEFSGEVGSTATSV